jgi:hypothetical protein
VQRLASEDLAVARRAGSGGAERLEAFVRTEGSSPESRAVHLEAKPFGLGVADLLSSRDLVITTDGGREVLKDAFRPLFNSAERQAGTPLPFAEGAGAVPLPGKIADTSPEGLAAYAARIDTGIVPAILVAPSDAARRALAPFLDAPNVLTPESAVELRKPGRGGLARRANQVAPWIAARRTRGWPDARPLRIPVLVLEEHAVARLEGTPAVTSIDFAVAFGPERAAWERGEGGADWIATWLPPEPRAARPPVVVVSAHVDSWGRDGDVLFRGADDNASGVACVLEAMGETVADLSTGSPKAGVVFALFDGEEWGLQGSRAAVATLAKDFDVRAVVNVDAVGRVRDDAVFVVGVSKHPDLAAKAKEALATEDLKVGRDIDAFAYDEGSDHWPFHEAGIPAITLYASDYATMDTPADTPDKVDPVGVARLAKALRRLVVRLATE